MEIAKLKTFFEYSLSLKDKSLSAAEADLEKSSLELCEQREKLEQAEADAIRLRATFDDERDRMTTEWLLKSQEQDRRREEALKEVETRRREEEDARLARRPQWLLDYLGITD